jgi:competence protein ComEA
VSASIRALAIAAALLLAAPALAAKARLGPNERVDLNRASLTELMRLPGVGAKRAQAITAARAKRPFKRLEDVLVVKGIGPAWLAKVRNNVQTGAAAPAAPSAVQARR